MQKMSEKEAIEIHIAENIHKIEVIENFMYRVPDADKEKCRKNISVLSKINGLLQEIQQYRAIGTVEECREAVERMKPMSTNENIITISLYFEIHDADMYGGKGTIGYANTNVDLEVSVLAKADINNYVEMQRQGVAEMCKIDKEKVIVISRTAYKEETDDEDEYSEDDYF